MQDTKNNLDFIDNVIDRSLNEHDFPIHIFPKAIQDLINDANETVGFQKDYFAAAILSVCATSMGGSNCLDFGSYKSMPILWISVIGKTGTGKSHPLDKAIEFLERKDMAEYLNYKSLMSDFDKDLIEKKPIYRSTVLKDFTIEKLAEKFQYNDTMIVHSDELIVIS